MATPLQAPGLASLQRQVSSPSNTGPAAPVTTATGTGKTTAPAASSSTNKTSSSGGGSSG